MTKNSKLALLGGKPVRVEPYKIFNPFGEEDKHRLARILDTGLLSGFLGRGTPEFDGGTAVREFEDAFMETFGVKHAVSMNSASSGLHAAMVAVGIKPGDEVLTTPYTMSATAAAIVQCGATPVYVDIESDMFCLNVRMVEQHITERTKAILTVNLFGQPSDIIHLKKLADKHGLFLVEDNAQAPLAGQSGMLAGTVGHIGVFSLNRHKTMQVGEGGVAVTNDDTLAERLRLVRNHGECALWDWKRNDHTDIAGCNYRLTELQAVLATPQLAKLSGWNKKRQEQADRLSEVLKEFDFLQAPQVRSECSHVYYLYAMLYNPDILGIKRDTLVKALRAEGIHAANYHVPLYHLPVLRGNSGASCPVVEDIENNRIIVTKLCQQPCAAPEVEEFRQALEKICDNSTSLKQYETDNHASGMTIAKTSN